MNIITISREFGSGGREIGKRLADALGYAYYDREIEAGIAKQMKLDEKYVAHYLENIAVLNASLHFGNSMASTYVLHQQMELLSEKQQVLKKLASISNCVIVGRAADIVLAEYNPFKIFVYADMEHKIQRCQKYAEVEKELTPKEIEHEIKRIDSNRSQYHSLFMDMKWGDKTNYHLCINTSKLEIKKVVPHIAGYIIAWFS